MGKLRELLFSLMSTVITSSCEALLETEKTHDTR